MADTQEFLVKLINDWLETSELGSVDACESGEHPGLHGKLTVGAANPLVKAILQHFQQEQGDRSIKEIADTLNGSGSHACYCPRSVDGGCKCALKDEYLVPYAEVDGKKPYYTQSEVDRLIAETRLNLIEYFDQCSDNEKMNWKGLFEDTRKLAQSELDQLPRQKEGSK